MKEPETNKIKSTEEFLYKQVELLAEKSKDCELEDLRKNIDTLITVLEYLFRH